jgi:hypothetical protein
MLIIRKEQLKAFSSVSEVPFVRRVVRQLCEDHANLTTAMEDNHVQSLVETCLVKARKHGVVSEWGITVYCRLALVHGIGFDLTDDAALVFGSDKLDGNTRMEVLEEALGY